MIEYWQPHMVHSTIPGHVQEQRYACTWRKLIPQWDGGEHLGKDSQVRWHIALRWHNSLHTPYLMQALKYENERERETGRPAWLSEKFRRKYFWVLKTRLDVVGERDLVEASLSSNSRHRSWARTYFILYMGTYIFWKIKRKRQSYVNAYKCI